MPSRSERSRDTSAAPPADGDLLLTWLRLLGWEVRLERDGEAYVAHGRCILGSVEIEVAASGRSRSAAVVRLFEAAVERSSAAARSRWPLAAPEAAA
jgi:hypothetical protein